MSQIERAALEREIEELKQISSFHKRPYTNQFDPYPLKYIGTMFPRMLFSLYIHENSGQVETGHWPEGLVCFDNWHMAFIMAKECQLDIDDVSYLNVPNYNAFRSYVTYLAQPTKCGNAFVTNRELFVKSTVYLSPSTLDDLNEGSGYLWGGNSNG